MGKKKLIVAIAYDFDGTLAEGNMQEHSFIPKFGISKEDFWKEVKELAKKHNMDEILAYMHLMLKKANHQNISINKESFKDHGKDIVFFQGVETWFDRINEYAKEKGISIEHYIISSGLREMVEGTTINKHFKHVFASGFVFDVNKVAIWPAMAMNYTTKTQFLFRINKGILNCYDNQKVNAFTPEEKRIIPFSNMIYIGDGETDVPCMKMLKYQGGSSIAVYDPNYTKTRNKPSKKTICEELIKNKRADYIAEANYEKNSKLETLVQAIIKKVAVSYELDSYTKV